MLVLLGHRAAPAQGKVSVPDAAAQAEVMKLIQELYADQFKKARLPAQHVALANNMLQHAGKAKAGTAEHFVLLKVARDVAAKAGDAEAALKAVEQMARTYALDAAEMKVAALIEAGDHAGLPQQRISVVGYAIPLILEAADEDDYATAVPLAEMALAVARKARRPELVRKMLALDRRIAAASEAYAGAQAALKTLEENPTDAEANLAAGRFYCLCKGDWARGIPMLALGSDEQLKTLAVKELNGPASPEARVALGDAWWDLAQAKAGDEKTSLLFSAGYWYRDARAKVASPLIQMKLQGRLDQIAELKRSNPGLPARDLPLAVAPFGQKQAKRYQEVCAGYLGLPPVLTNSIGMKLVLIPPGEFRMGSAQEEIDRLLKEAKEGNRREWYIAGIPCESPQHRVVITRPFYLGMYEVTQAEYESVMGTNPSLYSASGRRKEAVAGKDTSRFPVETVTWEDATQFCRKLSALPKEKAAARAYRLPTEAEWEYACRAGTTTRYHFGDDGARLGEYAWFDGNSANSTHPVGQKKPNAWGLYDMSGNTSEWCMDWFGRDYYLGSPGRDPQNPARAWGRVTRGSAFSGAFPEKLRSALRGSCGPTLQRVWIGFRVAVTVAP
jgi:formylglycine-generating enzyme required for sulfatase activity